MIEVPRIPGIPVGCFDAEAMEFVTQSEYIERKKAEQTRRLKSEGATFDEYEKWANGWDWANGYKVYQGNTLDESTLAAFIAEKRKIAFQRSLAEYRKKCRMVYSSTAFMRARSRSRSVRRAGRHVSRSFITAGIDSGGGGDDGGDGQSDSDCIAIGLLARGSFGMVSARLGGLALNIYNLIATRQRTLSAQQERGARDDGRFFIPFWRCAA